MSTQSLLHQARRCHESGDLRQARDLYCQALEQDAKQPDAWYRVGLLAFQLRDFALAAKVLLQALALEPANANYANTLGAVQYAAGDIAGAVECYRHALLARPDHVEALSNLGVALLMQKRPAEAIASFRTALSHQPDNLMALNNLGNALQAAGSMDEAIACYERILALQPEHAEAYNNLGGVFRSLGRLDEAAARYRQALRLRPDMAEAHSNLGAVLYQLGQSDEAETCYRTALQLQPHQPVVHNNLGVLLRDRSDYEGAKTSFRQAIALKPDSASAYNNLGSALMLQGRLAESVPCYRKALELDPAYAVAHSNLLFALNYDDSLSPQALFAEHRAYGESQERIAPASRPHRNEPNPERRLRIGYMSPDLRNHALVRFFEPILANHDPAQVEVTCYAEVHRPDAVTERLCGRVHRWRSTCGRPDAHVAEMIRADGIDILVDLAGHTAGNRLPVFTHRPAPVQATCLGYPNTTGLRSIDYLITDAGRNPPGDEGLFTETLIRLDDFSCFQAPADAPPVNHSPCLRTGRLTFGSLHNLTKINDAVLDLWSRVLLAIPSARLLLFRNTLEGEVREQIRQRFLVRGITADRLQLRSDYSVDGYLSVYHDIDISLDVFPWGAGTTIYESLWMGVPMLTLRGNRFASRASSSVLTSVGLPELIATDADDFVARACWLDAERDWLARTREALRSRMQATICDGVAFARRFEAAYRLMWRHWCQRRKDQAPAA